MGTTVWIDEATRAELRRLQERLHTRSVNDTIRRLIDQPAADAAALFAAHRKAIRDTLRRHRLRRLVAFGSRARGDARPDSDLDLAVELGAGTEPLALLEAEAELEETLGLKVSLVEHRNAAVRAAVRREGVAFADG